MYGLQRKCSQSRTRVVLRTAATECAARFLLQSLRRVFGGRIRFGVRSFSRVGEETAFDEELPEWMFSQHVVSTRRTPRLAEGCDRDIIVNRTDASGRLRGCKNKFLCRWRSFACRVKMDTDENRISIRVGHCHSPSQRTNMSVLRSSLPCNHWLRARSETQCHVESHVFLGDPLTGIPPPVVTTMPGIITTVIGEPSPPDCGCSSLHRSYMPEM